MRTEALLYLTHHAHVDPLELMHDEADFADFSVSSAVVAYLARPGETQILEAAQQILASMVGEPSPERQRHPGRSGPPAGRTAGLLRSAAFEPACRS